MLVLLIISWPTYILLRLIIIVRKRYNDEMLLLSNDTGDAPHHWCWLERYYSLWKLGLAVFITYPTLGWNVITWRMNGSSSLFRWHIKFIWPKIAAEIPACLTADVRSGSYEHILMWWVQSSQLNSDLNGILNVINKFTCSICCCLTGILQVCEWSFRYPKLSS